MESKEYLEKYLGRSEKVDLLVVEIDSKFYGIPVAFVEEVIETYEMVDLPSSAHPVKGIIWWCGEPLPVLEASSLPRGVGDLRRGVLKVVVMTIATISCGLLVDRVVELISLERGAVEFVPAHRGEGDLSCVVARVSSNGRMFGLLDVEGLAFDNDRL